VITVIEITADKIVFRDENGKIVEVMDKGENPTEQIKERIKRGLNVHESLKEMYFPKKK